MKILFIHKDLKSFVRADLEILRSKHDVKVVKFKPDQQFVQEVIEGIKWCNIIFGWWASWHLLLPIILAQRYSRRVVVVGGDYDVIFDKRYKSQKRLLADKLRKSLGYFIFPKIDRYITFSDFSKAQACLLPYMNPEHITRIYCGLPDIAGRKKIIKTNQILSVGSISRYDIYRKGHGTFVRSASYLPNYQFQLIGHWEDDGIKILRSWNDVNVKYTGFLPEQDLFKAMSVARVYVQVSYLEGFGMALAEAMIFQCVPVVTNRGSIPEIVGDTGLYVPYGDPQSTAYAIKEACERWNELGSLARDRILSMYPIENRKTQLLNIIEQTYFQNKS